MCTSVHKCTHMYASQVHYMHMLVHKCISILCTNICMRSYMYMYTLVYIFVYTCVCLCTHTPVCTLIHYNNNWWDILLGRSVESKLSTSRFQLAFFLYISWQLFQKCSASLNTTSPVYFIWYNIQILHNAIQLYTRSLQIYIITLVGTVTENSTRYTHKTVRALLRGRKEQSFDICIHARTRNIEITSDNY